MPIGESIVGCEIADMTVEYADTESSLSKSDLFALLTQDELDARMNLAPSLLHATPINS